MTLHRDDALRMLCSSRSADPGAVNDVAERTAYCATISSTVLYDRLALSRGGVDLIRQLTFDERSYAFLILLAMVMAGLAMAVLGKSDPLGIHGVIVLIYSGILLYFVLPC